MPAGRQGFTLIELMIVMGIVAVLGGAVSVISITGNLQKGRDGRRQTDLEAIRSALEIYRSDKSSYIVASGVPDVVLTTLRPDYTQAVPVDPSASYKYYYSGTATGYSLCAYLEKAADANLCAGNCGTKSCNYKVTNP